MKDFNHLIERDYIMTRPDRIKAAIWLTLQKEIRKNDYKAISSKLNNVSNSKENVIEELSITDREVIENILSGINEFLENY